VGVREYCWCDSKIHSGYFTFLKAYWRRIMHMMEKMTCGETKNAAVNYGKFVALHNMACNENEL
jgi:hypothetical protein